jgi:hypothetical protein
MESDDPWKDVLLLPRPSEVAFCSHWVGSSVHQRSRKNEASCGRCCCLRAIEPALLYNALGKFAPFGVDPFYPQMSSQDFE